MRSHSGKGPPPTGPDQYEYRTLTFPRTTSRAEARRLLTEQADYGRWELDLVRVSFGGVRRVRLRRKIIRVVRTA
ncbi:DUF5703 family protein [Kineococcus glutinatus]|uniref:Uncharacterized protein n=1 Tax=Kineococcus glutinatus TaxID=1070872 RepID=A0ABP9IAD3_9ACTN